MSASIKFSLPRFGVKKMLHGEWMVTSFDPDVDDEPMPAYAGPMPEAKNCDDLDMRLITLPRGALPQ